MQQRFSYMPISLFLYFCFERFLKDDCYIFSLSTPHILPNGITEVLQILILSVLFQLLIGLPAETNPFYYQFSVLQFR
jgi:hypothetical protein